MHAHTHPLIRTGVSNYLDTGAIIIPAPPHEMVKCAISRGSPLGFKPQL